MVIAIFWASLMRPGARLGAPPGHVCVCDSQPQQPCTQVTHAKIGDTTKNPIIHSITQFLF